MNKYIKKIIAGITTINIFAMFAPAEYISLLKDDAAYAATKPYLKKIYVDSGYDINFSYLTYTYNLKVSNSLNEITVKARAEKVSDIVRINGVVVNKENKYKQLIKLDKEVNKVEIEVEDSNNSSNITTYTLYITKGYITPADDLNEVTNANNVFLDNITLDGEEIGFKKRIHTYNIRIDDYDEVITLNAELENESDSVNINGRKSCTVPLGLRTDGKYVITVVVENAETNEIGTYTLNLYRGIEMPEKPVEIPKQPPKADQWVRVKGRWQYNDSLGNALKNTWYFDPYYDRYFYLDEDGNMKTGWLNKNGVWYYLDESGAMKTGWLHKDKKWYHLDYNGAMHTGWYKWNNDWYCFNEDGTMMESQWICSNNYWYYLKSTGEMLHNGFLSSKGKYYYLNDNGAMQTESKEINGYLFDFDEDGSVILN